MKSIPTQKLPIHRKITHFCDITLLRGTSPLLFKFIVLCIYFFQNNLQTLHSAGITHVQNWVFQEPNWRKWGAKESEAIEGAEKEANLERRRFWGGRAERCKQRQNQNREVLCFYFLTSGLFLSLSYDIALLCFALLWSMLSISISFFLFLSKSVCLCLCR